MSARDAILARIRAARAGAPEPPGPAAEDAGAAYRVAGTLGEEERLALLQERLEDYGVRVRRCVRADLAATVGAALRARRAAELAAPAGVPEAWRPAGVSWLADAQGGLALAKLAELDGVLTGCAVAIAETGTLALDAGETQGRRALTLVPDYHLCVVMAEQVVQTVPEAVRRLEPSAREGRPITLVSGPSATSDIELSRVAGVHGPRTLEVVLVSPERAA